MTTLTDRYVWAVLRSLPNGQRAELEPEIRALIADAIEAREASGIPAPDAERAALVELGDPDALAARYMDRPLALIGPRLYPEWRRLLMLLLPIVVPLATAVTVALAAVGGQSPSELVGTGITAALNVAIQLVFWFTLVFALIERAGATMTVGPWTPERLPELPAKTRPGLAETVTTVVAIAVGLVLLGWQQVAKPIVIDGTGHPLFNADLWSFWLPYFALLLVIEAIFAVVLWRAGGYTWTLATVNVVTGLAFLLPALKLLQDGVVFDPGLAAAVEKVVPSNAFAPLGVILGVLLVISQALDIVEGYRKAAQRGDGLATA